VLSAAFNFDGTGGIDGAFDWVVPTGVHILLDTSGAISIGGDDIGANMENLASFSPDKTMNVVGGKINVRHLVIQDGASIKAQGVNPVSIQASGDVLIRGTLDVSGFDRPDVATLGTGNVPEVGAPGAGGGGDGGTASFLSTTSTPQGGNGFGPLGLANLGGQGGESGFGLGTPDNSRPGGGGGGRLGADAEGADLLASPFGLIAEPGFDGGPQATGAVTGLKPPRGGAIGFSPFTDGDSSNDFLGASFDGTDVVLGELSTPSAGSGGGAGGDSIPDVVFPHTNWKPGSDEKGCGGGGGAGSLYIRCLGDITIQGNGKILAEGGRGGSGENTINNDHKGGGSGGGSGGHIVLEAGSGVVFDGVAANCISALGGKGGAGKPGIGETINKGGSGGPGIVQIHVLNPAGDISLINTVPSADNLGEVTLPDALTLVPSFGTRSIAVSRWIQVGGAAVNPGGGTGPVTFFFDGTDPVSGLALDANGDGTVDLAAPILGPVSLVASPGLPSIGLDLRTLTVDVSAIAGTFDDLYLRNPLLLRDAVLELREVGAPTHLVHFNIANATFDDTSMQLAIEVDGAPAPDLTSFDPPAGLEYVVYPNSFRVVTSGIADLMPSSVAVRIRFEGAPAGPDGLPDVDDLTHVDMTGDISELNANTIDFVRFEVLFDIDADGAGLSATSSLPALDFLRVKFRF
jgi:hypothetical protein